MAPLLPFTALPLGARAHRSRIGSARIAWLEAGQGPPLVLLHGLAASRWWWTPVLRILSRRYRVHVVDLFGFGDSHRQPVRLDRAAKLLAAWLDQLGVARATLVGHSMGGFVAADLAAGRPDLVERLVLVDAAGLPLPRTIWAHIRHMLQGASHAPLGLAPLAIADFLRAGPRAIASAGHQLLSLDLEDRLDRIAAPTLVVWGADDRLLPASSGRALAAAISGARFAAIPGAGHNPMWERPAAFLRVLLEFLAAPAAPGSGATNAVRERGQPVAADPSPLVTRSTGGRVRSTHLPVGDWSIHVRYGRPPEAGSVPIVLVHGFVISSRYHVPTLKRLARRHAVMAPDLPGFGWSSRPRRVLDVPGLASALAAILDAAGVERALLVGNSLGSQVAAEFAARYPERTAGLVLTGPTFDPGEPSLFRQFLRLLTDIPREKPSLWLLHLPDYVLVGPRRAFATLRHAWRHRIEDVLPHIAAPAVVVRGSRDPLVPPAWAARAADLLPDGRLVEVDGAGHAVNHGAPASVVAVVEGLLAGPPSPPAVAGERSRIRTSACAGRRPAVARRARRARRTTRRRWHARRRARNVPRGVR